MAWVIVIFVVALLAIVIFSALFLLPKHRPYKTPERDRSSRQLPAERYSVVPDEAATFAQYGGSASCKECHEEAYAAWKNSNHGLAERLPDAAMDGAAFHPSRTFQHGTQRSTVLESNGQFHVVTIGLSNRQELFAVERVIGHDPLRQFLVKFPGGRLQTLEASYDPHRSEWFNVYGNEDRRPGEWGHWTGRGMNWNAQCAACHNTRLRKNYDETNDVYRTAMVERTVGCESCHGPLKAHNDWQKQFGKSGKKDPTLNRLTPSQTMNNCAFCHARRSDLTGDFKPGDDFHDHMRLAIVDGTDTYYPDGQVWDEDYEFAAFHGSRMHMAGVKCTDCHNPHTMKTVLPGNFLCMRCHNGSVTNAPLIEPVSHSRHKVFGYDTNGALTNIDLTIYNPKTIKETGGECVNCHMPQTAYMQRHWRHDHGFTIPDPLLTRQHGIPNACNRCHKDKDADWALKYTDEWYGGKMERPSRRRTQIIAAAKQGDANARDGLLDLLKTEENPYWRAVAAGFLRSWTGEPQVNAALLRGLADTNAMVRQECLRSLEPLLAADDIAARQAVQKLLEDDVRSVRVAAAWALRSSVDLKSRAGVELLHSMDINSDQPAGQMQKGAFALARNDPQQALAHYQKAVAWDSNSAAIRNDYAVVLATLGRSAEAVEQLEVACNLEPRNADLRYRLALAWNEAGNVDNTIESLRAALQLDSSLSPAWYNLGLALNVKGQGDESLAALTRAESLSPGDARIPYARATILAQRGRHAEARQSAQRALEIDPHYTPARRLLQALPR